MRSKTSFFNKGLSLSLLRRSWPVWGAYFGVLFLMVPANLMSIARSREYRSAESMIYLANSLNRNMLEAGQNAVILSFFACVLVAMAMYGFMYNSRSCSMYCSLPIKRETVFSTAFITGLVPMLLIDLVIALICLVSLTGENMMDAKNVWLFLAMAVMGNICFYGFASFCTVLTGNLFVLPAVYGVLNIAVLLAEVGVREAFNVLIYGYALDSFTLSFLSPIAQLVNSLRVETVYQRLYDGGMKDTGNYILHGMDTLAIYCAAGLVFAFLGLLLYRRRSMETVSDVVSIAILKPIFKYCMCFGVSLMLAYVLYSNIFARSLTAGTAAAAYLGMMLAGAFIGYFVSEMLMQKTLRVFRGKWKGFLISCAVICAFIAVAELDLTGYETRLPETDEVDYVTLSYYDGGELHEQENIRAVREFQQQLIESKAINESAEHINWIHISYHRKDGSVFNRRYPLSLDLEQKRDEQSPVNTMARIINSKEAIMNRALTSVPVTGDNVMDAYFSAERIRDDGEREHFTVKLSGEKAAEFYNDCILPDAEDCRLCRVFPVENEEYFSQVTPVSFNFSVYIGESSIEDRYRNYYDFTMYLDAERCCEWIRENTEIELISMGERDPEYRDEMLNELYCGVEAYSAEYMAAAAIERVTLAPNPAP